MVLDCYGCRASVPRFCATCVQQAITERRERLREEGLVGGDVELTGTRAGASDDVQWA